MLECIFVVILDVVVGLVVAMLAEFNSRGCWIIGEMLPKF